MGELLVGGFALIGLAIVVVSAAAFWADASDRAGRTQDEAITRLQAVAASAAAAMHEIANRRR